MPAGTTSTNPHRRGNGTVGRLLALILCTALLAVGCGGSDSAGSDNASDATDVSLLFSALVPSMVISADGAAHRLTVPLDSPVAWFTDRPNRAAGTFDMAALVSIWEAEGFVDDPPNAAVVVSVDGAQRQHIVELSDPTIDGTTVSFTAIDVGDEESTDAVAGRDASHDVGVGTYGASELFIDSATMPPCPSWIGKEDFATCLIAANTSVNFRATTSRSNDCIQLTRTVSTKAEYGNILMPGVSGGMPFSITGAQGTFCLLYTSGQTWTIKVWPNSVTFSVGPPQDRYPDGGDDYGDDPGDDHGGDTKDR